MNNNFFSHFTPKEPKFFPILKEMADVMLAASEIMIEFVKNYDHETAPEYYKRIKEQELKGDALSNRVFDELDKTFITPFDREDINQLAGRLDDVTDYINSCAKKIVLYNPAKLPASALEIVNLIHEDAVCIGKAIDELDVLKKDAKQIKKYCKDLHDIENKADDVYEHFIIELFENAKDSIEVIKLKEIMNGLEKTTDAAEYVGKIIKMIIVKNA
jgi:predicted phosphate transport protein (TIGR00153 family)